MNIFEKLLKIQSELKAPKDLFNKFGNYSYRSAESILEALKPLLEKYKATLVVSDEIVVIGEHNPILYTVEVYDNQAKQMKEETVVTGSQRYYIKATASIIDAEKEGRIDVSAYAREDETRKGMDLSQLTGSTSSYARKYALNGLFAIDDTKDSDSTNTHDKEPTKAQGKSVSQGKSLSEGQVKRLYALGYAAGLDTSKIKDQVKTKFNKEVKDLTKEEYEKVCEGYEGLKK